MTFFNAGCILLGAYYLYAVSKSLYELTHPLHGLHITKEDMQTQARPLWQQGQKFDLYCFLSASTLFPAVNLSNLAQARHSSHPLFLVYAMHGLVYNESSAGLSRQQDFSVLLNITARPAVDDASKQYLPAPEVWSKLRRNDSLVYLHVLLVGAGVNSPASSTCSISSTAAGIIGTDAFASGRALHGRIPMLKFDRIPKSFRYRYLLADWGLVETDPVAAAKAKMHPDTKIAYWKPEVCVRLVSDWTHYPQSHVPEQIHKRVISGRGSGKGGRAGQHLYYRPPFHADEIGLTSDKYVPLNGTVSDLPLRLSYSAMSLQRWLLMQHLEESLTMQKEVMQFSDKDMDDIRRLISDTPLLLLLVTVITSLLHLIFELLSFQSDIDFWRNNKSLAGLSARSVCTDLLSQVVVFLFLIDGDTSLLVTIPSFAAILIQCWKVQRATGLSMGVGVVWGFLPVPTVRLLRLTAGAGRGDEPAEPQDPTNACPPQDPASERITSITLKADRSATTHLSMLLLPLVLGFTVRSLFYDQYASWYSWAIGSLCGAVYAFGFVLMCPQLYINHKLKSVSHLPWKYLVYKFINTFIDDLFAFMIKVRVRCVSVALHRITLSNVNHLSSACPFPSLFPSLSPSLHPPTTLPIPLSPPSHPSHPSLTPSNPSDAHDAPPGRLPRRHNLHHLHLPTLHIRRRCESATREVGGVCSIIHYAFVGSSS